MYTAEHYYNVIEQLRTNYSKKFVYDQPNTPIALIREISEQILFNQQSSVLVMFTVEWAVYLRMEKTIADITVVADNDVQIEKICKAIGVKYINIKDLNKNMKFDVVVGNPPYNNDVGENREKSKNTNNSNLYFEFIEKSISLGITAIALIVPAAWMSNRGIKARIVSSGLCKIEQVDIKMFPTVKIRSGISIIHIVKGYVGEIIVTDVSKNSYEFQRHGGLVFDNPIKHRLVSKLTSATTFDKILSSGPYKVPSGVKGKIEKLSAIDPDYSLVMDKTHLTKVLIYTGGTVKPPQYMYHTSDITLEKYGVVIPSASDKHKLGSCRKLLPFTGASNRVKVAYFDSSEMVDNCILYLESKIVRFIIDVTKYNDTVNTNLNSFGNIPVIDFSRAWSDKELYAHFNLTQEEIDLIESTVK